MADQDTETALAIDADVHEGESVIALSDWKNSLADDVKADPILQDVNDVPTLVKNYLSTKRLVGADTVKIPGKDGTPDEFNAFFNRLGRPEEASKYEVPTENMPENFAPDETRLNAMREEAHRLGITSQQFAGLIRADANYIHGQSESNVAAQVQANEAATNELKVEWGVAYDQNTAIARSAVSQFGGEALKEYLNTTGKGNDPVLVRAFYAAGRALGEDEVHGSGGGQKFTNSPSDAQDKIDLLMADKDFRKDYFTGHLPGHKAAVEKIWALQQEANPEPEVMTL